MAKIIWDAVGARKYETGVDQGVLYPTVDGGAYGAGVAWNGLVNVSESPSGAEATPIYADNIKYLNLLSAEEFGCTIEAFTYPDEFEACDGSASLAEGVQIGQQPRIPFGFSYRTKMGNDSNPEAGYKIHIVYGCTAAPSEKAYATVNDSPEAITFSWEVTTTPVLVSGHKPTATLILDSTKLAADKLTAIEAMLYGDGAQEAKLPTIAEILDIVEE